MAKKILVTGRNGQLGRALQEALKDEETLFTDVEEMDITNESVVEQVFGKFKPDWLVHCAAYTNVDGCEEDPGLAEKLNKTGTEILVDTCQKHEAKMIYISTDYAFDGQKKRPYTEEDETNPQSVYGKTKLAGEKAALTLGDAYILRTQWLYGDGKNFVKTMLALSEKMDEIKIVDDQLGRPTSAIELARIIYEVIKKEPPAGIYHTTNDGEPISWAEFAKEIFRLAGKKTKVISISTEEYLAQYPDKKIASRPAYSTLSLEKISKIAKINDWKESLKNYNLSQQ